MLLIYAFFVKFGGHDERVELRLVDRKEILRRGPRESRADNQEVPIRLLIR